MGFGKLAGTLIGGVVGSCFGPAGIAAGAYIGKSIGGSLESESCGNCSHRCSANDGTHFCYLTKRTINDNNTCSNFKSE